MTKRIFTAKEGNIDLLVDLTIAVIGYGNQGRAQALNMRDSGLKVIIGNKEDEYKNRAKNDGFEVYSINEAAKQGDILFFLISDEIMEEIYDRDIKENLKDKGALVFASGYNVAFGIIKPLDRHDILLIAPRMIGMGVRERFLSEEGFYSFIHVENDSSGNANEILLALCKAIGTLKKGAIDVSFKQEAVLDLFNEQAFGPAFGHVLLTSIYTLIDAGYPAEAVLTEMFMSEEMSYTYKKMAQVGLVKQVEFHSQTSQYGAMSRGIKFRNLPLKKTMKEILENIESGKFAEEWKKKTSKIIFRFLKFFATKTRINKLEQDVRSNLKLKEMNNLEYLEPNIDEFKEIKEEIKEFEEYFKEL
ncbi:MAG: NAD(P)-binding domain-containing protein [Candidatus Heimdallarchaeota archaeon]|nr:NAD(P)-binding domain-containing protein [Candidatus Heimdallarchaeota archaeon]MCK4954012.1 NAD(P)-binding domain-containing protein [Candidatus Heimdallarchaeota archaeon]